MGWGWGGEGGRGRTVLIERKLAANFSPTSLSPFYAERTERVIFPNAYELCISHNLRG